MEEWLEAPKEVYDFITGNELFSRSGDEYRGKGGDYIKENENKHIKGHLGPGVPTLQHGIRASRNHEKLQAICVAGFKRAGLKDPGLQSSSIFKFDIEVQVLRAITWDSSTLDVPYSQLTLKAIDSTLPHHDLVNFMFTAMENYNSLIENPEADLQPVFVMYEDKNIYNDVKTWTVKRIHKNIEIILNGMNDIEIAAEYSALHSWMKNKRKQKLIVFYKELKIIMEKEAAKRSETDVSSKLNSDWKDKYWLKWHSWPHQKTLNI